MIWNPWKRIRELEGVLEAAKRRYIAAEMRIYAEQGGHHFCETNECWLNGPASKCPRCTPPPRPDEDGDDEKEEL